MTTRELLESLPENVRANIKLLRNDVLTALPDTFHEMCGKAAGYATGLRDAGLITERQRCMLVLYMFL